MTFLEGRPQAHGKGNPPSRCTCCKAFGRDLALALYHSMYCSTSSSAPTHQDEGPLGGVRAVHDGHHRSGRPFLLRAGHQLAPVWTPLAALAARSCVLVVQACQHLLAFSSAADVVEGVAGVGVGVGVDVVGSAMWIWHWRLASSTSAGGSPWRCPLRRPWPCGWSCPQNGR